MQRCPYISEMKGRLLGSRQETLAMDSLEQTNLLPESRPESHLLSAEHYAPHISPAHQRTPLVPPDLGEDFSLINDEVVYLDPRKPKNAKTSLFIVTSLVYAIILIVVCIAYVISDVSTHRIPVMYYEGFFTYLYGISILFLLYVFCFLLQESTCCNGGSPKPKKTKESKPKKQKSKKGDDNPEGKANKPSPYQEVFPKKKRDVVREQSLLSEDPQPDPETAVSPAPRRRKTTQDAHGSFFLRIGAIAFGLGTMIYTGLEVGSFFEIPFTSPCHVILRGVNPLLQMIFTFMQMYFIFMNSRVILNIHRFKVVARFGLMHIVATNLCVWIRTLVLESLKEITAYHQNRTSTPEDSVILESIRQHSLRNAGLVMGTELGPNTNIDTEWEPVQVSRNIQGVSSEEVNVLQKLIKTTTETITTTLDVTTPVQAQSEATSTIKSTTAYLANLFTTTLEPTTSTTPESTTLSTSTVVTTDEPTSTPQVSTSTFSSIWQSLTSSTPSTTTDIIFQELTKDSYLNYRKNDTNLDEPFESLESLFPNALVAVSSVPNTTSCGRINIMGTIVHDSAPYLYPFIVEYSLIGAVVIYVMWRHIGRYQKSSTEEDLEHRLEVMLSRRAVALAQAQTTRVDCVGASKGLFFGLLLLVGSLICLILFFVLVRHPQLSLLAMYLADVSHAGLMVLTILAILIGFCRVQNLKFRIEDQSNLNDILLRISAFGLFTYSAFSIIAGSLNVLESVPNLLVLVTSGIAVLQVVLQLLFIADVSRRRVHLPEHDRSKPGRQIVTFLLISNISMFVIYTFEVQKVAANPVQLDFYGFVPWSLIQRVTLPLCIFHRFYSAVTLAEIWKTTYKARLE